MILLKNVILNNKSTDILIKNGKIAEIGKNLIADCDETYNANGLSALPSFVDMHVHFRDPGLTHKESILSGSVSALNGGFSAVACMPNTKPVLDTTEWIEWVKKQPKFINVLPIAAVTKNQEGLELTNFEALKKAGAIAFSDDGAPVENCEIMEKALRLAKKTDVLIISHCEDKSVITNRLNIPRESESNMVSREVDLAKKLGARIHIAHVSTKESIEIIRKAKQNGVSVTCETAPHYFSITDEIVEKFGNNARMNPPLRKKSDVDAVISGLIDGTIDVIATDHAPHSSDEKALPAEIAPFGIVGLETSFSLGLKYLVNKKHLTLEKLIEVMSLNPSKILRIPANKIEGGNPANFILANLTEEYIFDVQKTWSKSKNSPYNGEKLIGKVKYNIVNGVVNKCQQTN